MLIPLLLALQVPLAARADTLRPLHDAVDYDITLLVGDSAHHVLGQVRTKWRLRSDLPVRIDLDPTLRVARVMMDGKENTRMFRTTWARDGGWVVIPHQKGAGDSVVTDIRYHGSVRQGMIFGTAGDGTPRVFADNWPDRGHGWLASQDHPSDKATATIRVEVPPGLQAIANGDLIGVDSLPRGRTVWVYRIAEPIPVYTMVVGIARFAVTRLPDAACAVRCVPLAVWAFPEDSAYAVNEPFRRAGQMLDYLSGLVGPFPYERLSHVEARMSFIGGMENSTAIFYSDSLYRAHLLDENTVAHETAHQWFGDAVTEDDWHHLWLSEGFATYFATLWEEHLGGDSALVAGMREAAREVFESPASERPILDLDVINLESLLNTNNYEKGAWTLHSLRGLLGDSVFFRGIREYYRRYRDSTALSADFARVMEQVSGRDLDWYFAQALTQPGYPRLEIRWRAGKGKRLTLDITQTQPEAWGDYRLPGLVLDIDGKRVAADVAGRETHLVLQDIPSKPKRIEVDPDGWWLVKTTVRNER